MSADGIRIGIDVGGTNTDAVLMAGRRVLGAVKCATTPDVGSGIAGSAPRGVAAGGGQIRHVSAP